MTVTDIIVGDCRTALRSLPAESVHCAVTSPPYFGLRDYDVAGQLGLEPTPEEYISEMVAVFREVRRVLRTDGTVWLNIGDSYAGSGKGRMADGSHGSISDKQSTNKGTVRGTLSKANPAEGLKPKDLIGIPWMLAFALRHDGWWLRQDIIWSKPNPMPESTEDRCTKAHEYLFLLSKSQTYFFDFEAIMEPAIYGDVRTPYGSKGAWALDGRPELQRNGGKRRKSCEQGEFGGKTADQPQPAFRSIKDWRRKRSVWHIAPAPFKGAHFATFPPALVEPCILAGCPAGGTVLDPFGGAGTTGLVAEKLGRNAVLVELNPAYAQMACDRINAAAAPIQEAA